jgi:hypothetical protein
MLRLSVLAAGLAAAAAQGDGRFPAPGKHGSPWDPKYAAQAQALLAQMTLAVSSSRENIGGILRGPWGTHRACPFRFRMPRGLLLVVCARGVDCDAHGPISACDGIGGSFNPPRRSTHIRTRHTQQA